MAITIVDIPVSQLMPNPHNPRRDVGDVTELADSIRAQGIKQELLVTPAGTWCRAVSRSLRRARNAS